MGKASRRKKYRTVRMTPEVSTIIRKQLRAFRKKFGREPGPDDPVFFDPDAETPKPISEDWLTEQAVAAMARAGIDAQKIYAYRKTGLIATQENWHLMSEADRRAWEEALAEYEHQMQGKPH
jgi:integrase